MSVSDHSDSHHKVNAKRLPTDDNPEQWITEYLQRHCHEGMSFQAKIAFLTELEELTGLTPSEAATLRVFMSFGDGDGKNVKPSTLKIAALRGKSPRTIEDFLTALTRKGWLRSVQSNHRKPPIRAFRIPPNIEARIQAALRDPNRKKQKLNENNKPHWTLEKIWAASLPNANDQSPRRHPHAVQNRSFLEAENQNGSGKNQEPMMGWVRENTLNGSGKNQDQPIIDLYNNLDLYPETKEFRVAKEISDCPNLKEEAATEAIPYSQLPSDKKLRLNVASFLFGDAPSQGSSEAHSVTSLKQALNLATKDMLPAEIMETHKKVQDKRMSHDEGVQAVIELIVSENSAKNVAMESCCG